MSFNRSPDHSRANSSRYQSPGPGASYEDSKFLKQENLKTIIQYLRDNNFGQTIQTKDLSQPSKGLYNSVMEFLFLRVDPTFRMSLQQTFEDVYFEYLKNLRMPFRVSKSTLKSFSSAGSWSVILKAMAFLTDVLRVMDQRMPNKDIVEDANNIIFRENYQNFMRGVCSEEECVSKCLDAVILRSTTKAEQLKDCDDKLCKMTAEFEEHESVIERVQSLRESVEQEKRDLDTMTVGIEEMENENRRLADAIDKIEKVYENSLDTEHQLLAKQNMLRETIDKQEFSSSEVDEIIKEKNGNIDIIDNLRNQRSEITRENNVLQEKVTKTYLALKEKCTDAQESMNQLLTCLQKTDSEMTNELRSKYMIQLDFNEVERMMQIHAANNSTSKSEKYDEILVGFRIDSFTNEISAYSRKVKNYISHLEAEMDKLLDISRLAQNEFDSQEKTKKDTLSNIIESTRIVKKDTVSNREKYQELKNQLRDLEKRFENLGIEVQNEIEALSIQNENSALVMQEKELLFEDTCERYHKSLLHIKQVLSRMVEWTKPENTFFENLNSLMDATCHEATDGELAINFSNSANLAFDLLDDVQEYLKSKGVQLSNETC